jgi:hypothetical protein
MASGSSARKRWVRFRRFLYDMVQGRITLVECLHEWKKLAMPLLNYTLAFTLQLSKITGNLRQGSRLAKTPLCPNLSPLNGEPRLAYRASVHFGWPTGVQSVPGRHKRLPDC